MTVLQNNEGIEENAELVLKLEATGFLPRFDYQTCQPVFVPRPRDSADGQTT